MRGLSPGKERSDVRKPNLFIVGAPRCGTTSLWAYLNGHPDVFMSAEKELYFFDSDLWGRKEWAPTVADYLGQFCEATDQKIVGEATPSYLRSERAGKKIKDFNPGAQIIIMLRNPLDVMQSLHSQALNGPEPLSDFEAALEADAARTGPELIGYREFTDFPEQVERYFDLFGRENVHTIIFDDLMEKTTAVCQDLLRFLGVRSDYAVEFPCINTNQHPRNVRLQTMLWRPPTVLREMSRVLMPQRLRFRIRRTLLQSNRVVRPRPPMDSRLRMRLQRQFEPKVEQLSKLVGRDLSGWCAKPGVTIEK